MTPKDANGGYSMKHFWERLRDVTLVGSCLAIIVSVLFPSDEAKLIAFGIANGLVVASVAVMYLRRRYHLLRLRSDEESRGDIRKSVQTYYASISRALLVPLIPILAVYIFSQKISDTVSRGDRSYRRAEYTKALGYYQRAGNMLAWCPIGKHRRAEISNSMVTVRMSMGNDSYNLGKYDEALGHYAEAETLAKGVALEEKERLDIILDKAGALEGKGDLEKAMNLYKGILALDPHNIECLWAVAGLARECGLCNEALSYYRRLEMVVQNDRYLYYGVGSCLRRTGKLDEAMEYLLKAIRMAPKDMDSWAEIIEVIEKQGLHREREVRRYLGSVGFGEQEIVYVLESWLKQTAGKDKR